MYGKWVIVFTAYGHTRAVMLAARVVFAVLAVAPRSAASQDFSPPPLLQAQQPLPPPPPVPPPAPPAPPRSLEGRLSTAGSLLHYDPHQGLTAGLPSIAPFAGTRGAGAQLSFFSGSL